MMVVSALRTHARLPKYVNFVRHALHARKPFNSVPIAHVLLYSTSLRSWYIHVAVGPFVTRLPLVVLKSEPTLRQCRLNGKLCIVMSHL